MRGAILVALMLIPLVGATHSADPESQFMFIDVSPFGASQEDFLVRGLMNDHSFASNQMTIRVNGEEVMDVTASTIRPGLREQDNGSCNEVVARMQSDVAFLQLTIWFGPECPGHDGRGLGAPAAFSGPQPTGDPALQDFGARLGGASPLAASFDPVPSWAAIDPRGTGLVVWNDPLWCGSLHLSDADQAVTFFLESSECTPLCEDQHKGLGLGHQREGHPNKGEGGAKHAAPCPDSPGQGEPDKRGQGIAKHA